MKLEFQQCIESPKTGSEMLQSPRGSSNKRVNAIMSRVPQLSNATLSSFLLTFRAEGFPEYKFYQ
jgi:lipocalin